MALPNWLKVAGRLAYDLLTVRYGQTAPPADVPAPVPPTVPVQPPVAAPPAAPPFDEEAAKVIVRKHYKNILNRSRSDITNAEMDEALDLLRAGKEDELIADLKKRAE